jgi:hypothetical protein
MSPLSENFMYALQGEGLSEVFCFEVKFFVVVAEGAT